MSGDDHPVVIDAQFFPGHSGKLFVIHLRPAAGTPPQAVMYFPPFAEEMNKTRKAAMVLARRVAAQRHVVLVDLYGTGDSEGDFSAARWEIWRADMQAMVAWLLTQGVTSLTFWGVRLGCLLAMEVAATCAQVNHIVFWQPVLHGNLFMTQFLRLRAAADMMSGGMQSSTKELRAAAQHGEILEVAGYEIAPELLLTVDALNVSAFPLSPAIRLDCLEIATGSDLSASRPLQHAVDGWQGRELNAGLNVLTGAPFWATTEIVVPHELIDITAGLMLHANA